VSGVVSEEKIIKWEKYLIRLVIIIDLQMRNNKRMIL
jgi:hypothetical protein